jgi:hypothetical protein
MPVSISIYYFIYNPVTSEYKTLTGWSTDVANARYFNNIPDDPDCYRPILETLSPGVYNVLPAYLVSNS